MAGEDQYIHPIIAAMGQMQQGLIARQQLAQQLAAQQAEQQNRVKQTQIEQQRADQAEEALGNEKEYHTTMLKQQAAMQQAQMEMLHMQAIKGIRDEIASGIKPEALANSGSAPQQNTPGIIGGTPDTRAIDLPGIGLHIPISSLPSQQDLVSGEANRAGAIAGAQSSAEAQGALPSKLILAREEFANKKDLQNNENDFRARQQTNELASHEKIAQWDRGTQVELGKMRNDTELQGLNMRYNISPEDTQSAIAAIITGQVKPNFDNPIDRRLITSIENNGGRVLPPKDAEALQASRGMDPILKKLTDWSNKLPDEEKTGPINAVTNAMGLRGILGTGLSTDLKNELNQITSDGFAVARNVDSVTQGRIPMQEMNQVLNSFANVTTKQQARDNINYLKEKLDNRIGNVIEGGMPNFQQKALYYAYGVTPPWITQQIQIDKANPQGNQSKGLKPDVDESIKRGQVVYTGQ